MVTPFDAISEITNQTTSDRPNSVDISTSEITNQTTSDRPNLVVIVTDIRGVLILTAVIVVLFLVAVLVIVITWKRRGLKQYKKEAEGHGAKEERKVNEELGEVISTTSNAAYGQVSTYNEGSYEDGIYSEIMDDRKGPTVMNINANVAYGKLNKLQQKRRIWPERENL